MSASPTITAWAPWARVGASPTRRSPANGKWCRAPGRGVSTAWATDGANGSLESWADGMPFEVTGMLRSRANTIEGGTSEVNKNILGERVLGLPREPDPWHDLPWEDVPRS